MKITTALLFLPLAAFVASAAAPTVTLTRVPMNGLQPQSVVDAQGTVHVVFLTGKERASDVFYTTKRSGQTAFTKPVQVNQRPGSAIAVGTIRGAQLVLGKAGRVHVLWNGAAGPNGHKDAPLLYTRSLAEGAGFEPERNLMTLTQMLDGGGSIAADAKGNVYAVWHAALKEGGGHGEIARGVYVSASADDGASFAREERINAEPGVCGCCALETFVDDAGRLHTLYRGAQKISQRDMLHLVGSRAGAVTSAAVGAWRIGTCPMSNAAFTQTARGLLGAWETENRIVFAQLDNAGRAVKSTTLPGTTRQRHPTLAANAEGFVLLAWSENTAWQKGGDVAWQVFNKDGTRAPIAGRKSGVPVWGLPAAFPVAGGGFEILY